MTTSDDECPKCSYPLAHGRACQNCLQVEAEKSAQENRARRRTIDALGGERAYESYTEERFIKTEVNAAALAACITFDPERDNLFIFGPTGSGKNHLAAIAVRRFKPGGFLQMPALSLSMRMAEDAGNEKAIMDHWKTVAPLILDELGASKDTAFTLDLLYAVVNDRYRRNRNGLIVTSNLSLSDLATKLGEDRIPSRLADISKVFSLVGERDWRVARRPEGQVTEGGAP